MTRVASRRESAIAAALAQCARSVEEVGGGRWRIGLANGKPFPVMARLDEPWLLLEARPALSRRSDPAWELLAINGTIGGPSRLTLPPDGGALELRAEVPVWGGGEMPLAERLMEACRSMEEAFGCAHALPPPVRDREKTPAGTWSELLAEAEWTWVQRTETEIAVPLDAPGGRYQATIDTSLDSDVRIGADVATASPAEPFPPAVRRALGRMLLVGTGWLRLVRAAVRTPTGETVRLEVGFASLPSAAELNLALEAVTVGCRALGREANALARPEVARAYLDLIDQS